MINVILQFLGLDLFNIKLSAKFYQNIPNGLRVNFHFFQNLILGKTSTNSKCHLTILWAISCQYTNVYAKFHHNIPLSSRDRAIFIFFWIWSSAKPLPMKNDISQSLGGGGGARWLSGRVSDSGARGPGFETYRRRVVSLSKTLYSPKVLVNYPGSDGSVPIWLKNCWLGR